MYNKIVNGLKDKSDLEIKKISKLDRSLPYKAFAPLSNSSLTPSYIIEVFENGKNKKLIGIEKKDAKREYEKLKLIKRSLDNKKHFKIPEPYLILEKDDIVVTEYLEGNPLSELISNQHVPYFYEKINLKTAFKKIGRKLAEFHTSTEKDNKINFKKEISKNLEDIKKYFPEEKKKEILEININDITIPETYTHSDIGLGNLIYNKNYIGLVDWSSSTYGCPLWDLNRAGILLNRKNKYCISADLINLYKILIREYNKNTSYKVNKYTLHVSQLSYIVKKIKDKPERYNRDKYRNMLEDTVVRLKDIDS